MAHTPASPPPAGTGPDWLMGASLAELLPEASLGEVLALAQAAAVGAGLLENTPAGGDQPEPRAEQQARHAVGTPPAGELDGVLDRALGARPAGPLGQRVAALRRALLPGLDEVAAANPALARMLADASRLRLRDAFTARYSWTLFTQDIVETIAAFAAGAPIVDAGAGSGWLAHHLSAAGADVHAYDRHIAPDNPYHPGPLWHPVTCAQAPSAAAAQGPDAVLLLAWPPYRSTMGIDTVRAYPGRQLVYVGERAGCTGDEALAAELFASVSPWRLEHVDIPPRWPHTGDAVHYFTRTP